MTEKVSQQAVVLHDLTEAKINSFYTIRGAGGDIQGWVDGLGDELVVRNIGRPVAWYYTTGKDVNDFVGDRNSNPFSDDLRILMFPLDGLNMGKLAMFRLGNGDTWFDDMVANMGGE